MRLISWNMAGAGFHSAATHDDAWRWLTTEADFDVAILQESTPPQWVLEMFPVVIHNPNPGAATITLPNKGKWAVVVKGSVAGTKTIQTISTNKVSVAGQTTMVLTQ